jgi:hypothetical protein
MFVDRNASKTGNAVIGFHVSASEDGRTPLWATRPKMRPLVLKDWLAFDPLMVTVGHPHESDPELKGSFRHCRFASSIFPFLTLGRQQRRIASTRHCGQL